MNLKILNELEHILQASPQALKDPQKLKQLIVNTFNVKLGDTTFSNMFELAEKIDEAILYKYFSKTWRPSSWPVNRSESPIGLDLINDINSLKPSRVLDVGCGYNEFKGKIDNLLGIDPYNKKADIQVSILNFSTEELFDVILALGSINFGSTDKIFAELKKIVDLTAPGGKIFFCVNPGNKHESPESYWVSFYPWTNNFITKCATYFNVEILNLRPEIYDRIHFTWHKKT